MSGYAKLFGSIVHSTVWREPHHVVRVWVAMMALADRDGFVEASVPGLADCARVTLVECEEALGKFKAPDPYSRSKDLEGRRVVEADGGWVLVNFAKYRDRAYQDERRDKAAERMRALRSRNGSCSQYCEQTRTDENASARSSTTPNSPVSVSVSASDHGLPPDPDPPDRLGSREGDERPAGESETGTAAPAPTKKAGKAKPVKAEQTDPWGLASEDPDPVKQVFDYWATVLWTKVHQDRKPKPSEKRLSKIRARIADGYTVEQLKSVVDRVCESPYHLGENDAQRPYIELETIFRSPEKVDSWLAKAVSGGGIPKQSRNLFNAPRSGEGWKPHVV